MTLPEVHLAEEAVVAYVDGLLSPSAAARAERHLVGCAECCADVAAQQEMRAFLRGSGGPALPSGLMSRLLDVPMTADLGTGPLDAELVVDGDRIGWAAPPRRPSSGPRVVERTRTVEPVGAGAPIGVMAAVSRRPVAAAPSSRPAGSSGPGRPAVGMPRPAVGMPRRLRRHRRGLAVSLAGLAFGVIASAAATGTPGAAGPAPGTVVPGQPPTQITVGGNPLQATTFSFNRSSGRSALVADVSEARGR